MALFLQSARRKFLSLSSSRKITSVAQLLSQSHHPKAAFQTRSYISEMRKSAFEGNILRILRTEIQYQSEYAPPKEVLKSKHTHLSFSFKFRGIRGKTKSFCSFSFLFGENISHPQISFHRFCRGYKEK